VNGSKLRSGAPRRAPSSLPLRKTVDLLSHEDVIEFKFHKLIRRGVHLQMGLPASALSQLSGNTARI